MSSEQKIPRIEIRKTVRGRVPPIAYEKIAKELLGPQYELSLVICTDALARRVNRRYRSKGYAANVLAFPLDRHEGELFLNVKAAAREAKQFSTTLRARLILLFVHGCLHLKGMRHGKKMELAEANVVRKFS